MNTMLVTTRPLADAPSRIDPLSDPPPFADPLVDPQPVPTPVVAPADDPVLDAISYTVRWHHFLAIPSDC